MQFLIIAKGSEEIIHYLFEIWLVVFHIAYRLLLGTDNLQKFWISLHWSIDEFLKLTHFMNSAAART